MLALTRLYYPYHFEVCVSIDTFVLPVPPARLYFPCHSHVCVSFDTFVLLFAPARLYLPCHSHVCASSIDTFVLSFAHAQGLVKTEFADTFTGTKDHTVYDSPHMTAKDVADAAVFALGAPASVSISDVVMRHTFQRY